MDPPSPAPARGAFVWRPSPSVGCRRADSARPAGALFLPSRSSPDARRVLVEQIAAVSDYLVAVETYRAAVKRWPKDKITLRNRARVIEQSWKD